jgi:hypothetical protein
MYRMGCRRSSDCRNDRPETAPSLGVCFSEALTDVVLSTGAQNLIGPNGLKNRAFCKAKRHNGFSGLIIEEIKEHQLAPLS